jgi:hypothetical protein
MFEPSEKFLQQLLAPYIDSVSLSDYIFANSKYQYNLSNQSWRYACDSPQFGLKVDSDST